MLEKIKLERAKFHAYLNGRGLRPSAGRETVFTEVMQSHGHFAPEDLLRQCRRHDRRISRATVYRGLREMLEAGVIRETAYGDKHNHYEHLYDEKPHHHARCIRCGKILEFPDRGEDKVYRSYFIQQGFRVIGHEMHFYGICAKCR